jgi:hypothetical protein
VEAERELSRGISGELEERDRSVVNEPVLDAEEHVASSTSCAATAPSSRRTTSGTPTRISSSGGTASHSRGRSTDSKTPPTLRASFLYDPSMKLETAVVAHSQKFRRSIDEHMFVTAGRL